MKKVEKLEKKLEKSRQSYDPLNSSVNHTKNNPDPRQQKNVGQYWKKSQSSNSSNTGKKVKISHQILTSQIMETKGI